MRHLLILITLLALAACAPAAERVHVDVDFRQPGQAIPQDFLGFSYETAQLIPAPGAPHYFSDQNKPLIGLFKTIGVKSLRIGGNSVDRATTGIPSDADIDNLFAFAKASGVKVIYSVRLQDGDPQSAARIAKYIHEHYAANLDCFAIGNEPSYYKTYEAYHDKWKAILDAMLVAAPGSTFCAPDTNPNAEWCKNLVRDFGKNGPLVMITEHDYPGGCSYKNPFSIKNVSELIPVDAAQAREKMLSDAWYPRYAKVEKTMTDAVAGTGIPFRLDETNSLWYGGLFDASDTFASALWSADYLYWWAAHGTHGLNFHTGDKVGGGDTTVQSRYTAFTTTPNGFDVHPLSYGMKLFDLGGHGSFIPLTVTPLKDQALPDLSAYATVSGDTLSVTLLNKAHGPDARPIPIEIMVPTASSAAHARVLFLTAPDANISTKTGITLGNATIQPDGRWAGQWNTLHVSHGNTMPLTLAPASAAVIRVHITAPPTTAPHKP